jgi:hypothetical protein
MDCGFYVQQNTNYLPIPYAIFYFSPTAGLVSAALTTFSGGIYTVQNATETLNVTSFTGQLAVRAFLVQDRILYIQKRFFCDKATEKTIWLTVTDQFNYQRTVRTNKVRKFFRDIALVRVLS